MQNNITSKELQDCIINYITTKQTNKICNCCSDSLMLTYALMYDCNKIIHLLSETHKNIFAEVIDKLRNLLTIKVTEEDIINANITSIELANNGFVETDEDFSKRIYLMMYRDICQYESLFVLQKNNIKQTINYLLK